MARSKLLTKSRYLNGLQCIKRLWIEVNAPERQGSASPAQAQLRAQGVEVGIAARTQFPGGVLIRGTGRYALAKTQAVLAQGVTCLFEAAFQYKGVSVRCDILRHDPARGWIIVEVKATTQVKAHHLHDLAIQQWVLQGAGVDVAAVELMHLNSQGGRGDLFRRVDVTPRVARLLHHIPQRVARFQRRMAQRSVPRINIGPHCWLPYPCPVKAHCWQHVPRHSIFTIPRLPPDKVRRLLRCGILAARDVPADFPLTPAQRAYVEQVIAGRAAIDHAAIAERLAQLVYPIYFLDFETYAFAVPRFDGMRAYQQLPFQYSLHRLDADGRLTHMDFLYTGTGDPRPLLAAQLLEQIGPTGSVVVYNEHFERTVLQEVAHDFPEYRRGLRDIVARLWDQLEIFRNHYLDPAFEGSNSIKAVLPVLAPGLSYKDLAVGRGDQAQAVWRMLIDSRDAALRDELASALRAYCQRDTLAMVAIHQALLRLIEAADV